MALQGHIHALRPTRSPHELRPHALGHNVDRFGPQRSEEVPGGARQRAARAPEVPCTARRPESRNPKGVKGSPGESPRLSRMQLTTRFPDELAESLKALAESQDRSLNWVVVKAVEEYLSNKGTPSKPKPKVESQAPKKYKPLPKLPEPPRREESQAISDEEALAAYRKISRKKY